MTFHAVLRVPDHVHVGRGARASIAPSVARLGGRAVIVADPFLVGSAPLTELLAELDERGVATCVYSQVVPELPVDGVVAAANAVRDHDPDVVVGFGGGSALDLAKLVALLLRHPEPLSQYYGENAVPGPVVPIVAVPTTAGTGSEVTPVAVVSDPDRELKVGVSDAAIVPRVAVVDPELTVGAPPSVTAYSGIDALVHATEAHTAGVREPDWSAPLPIFVGRGALTSRIALEAVAAIGGSLPRAVADGGDLAARERMAYGSMLAGMAFGTAGTHLSHALQYPIGAITKTPHGLGTGLMLPYVLQACLPATVPQLVEIGDALGLPATGSDEARAQAAVDRIAAIVAGIGIPVSVADIGVEREQIPRIAELAAGVSRLAGNAAVPGDVTLLTAILDAAFAGRREALA